MTGQPGSPSNPSQRSVDHRASQRAKRRMMVKFGTDKADRTAFTGDVSATGIFLRTNSVVAPGTVLQIEIEFPERNWSLWGRVAWAKKVPSQLAHVLPCGMGIEFVEPPSEWFDFFSVWKVKNGLA